MSKHGHVDGLYINKVNECLNYISRCAAGDPFFSSEFSDVCRLINETLKEEFCRVIARVYKDYASGNFEIMSYIRDYTDTVEISDQFLRLFLEWLGMNYEKTKEKIENNQKLKKILKVHLKRILEGQNYIKELEQDLNKSFLKKYESLENLMEKMLMYISKIKETCYDINKNTIDKKKFEKQVKEILDVGRIESNLVDQYIDDIINNRIKIGSLLKLFRMLLSYIENFN